MKKIFICVAASALVFGLNFKAITSSSQPPAAYTGAPSESTCAASGCHTGNLNTGTGSVTLITPPSGYTPGTTYTLQIQVNQTGRTRFGFEFVALNSSNQQAGTLTLINTSNTAITSAGKTYLSHKNASSNNTWTFTWKAPTTNVGAVKFYFAGNAANGDGNTTGDNIYTSSLTLNPITTGLNEDQQASLKVFPNPANAKLNITNTEDLKSLTVFNITGKEVFKNEENTKQLDVSNLPNGTYFLQVEQAKTIQLKRFVVQH
jgi:hypothetical protein